jgi:hypothetical protein
MFLPMLGSVSLIAFSFVYNNPIFRLIAIGVAVLMLTVGIGMRLQQKHQVKKQRRKNAKLYRGYLSDHVHSAARDSDTVYANRAGALAEMGVLSAGEADLDAAQAQATADALKQFAVDKLLGLTPARKVPGLTDIAHMAFEEMFPADQVEKALEEQGAVQIDKLLGLRGLVVDTKVELGQLPPQAAGMVDRFDGSVSPDFVGGVGMTTH